MPQEKHSTVKDELKGRKSLEKWVPVLETEEDKRIVLQEAFDYRGDVTLILAGGEERVGYVFNREADAPEPYLEFIPRGSDDQQRILYKDISGVAFSGIDPAAGRSWENWVKRWNEKKKAAAEGRDIGNIEPQAMSLDDKDA
ncbi:MAG: hypothetical protein M5U26_05390 [Planctomycetota bacterium]|nr:hypothetical protein [Planctomycetota bacterium]